MTSSGERERERERGGGENMSNLQKENKEGRTNESGGMKRRGGGRRGRGKGQTELRK